MIDEALGRLLSEMEERLPSNQLNVAVAIPAKDEEDQIERCLAALGEQVEAGPFSVVLLVNNSVDGTAARARALTHRLPFQLIVVEVVIPGSLAHAGSARRLVMDLAAAWLRNAPGGRKVILTTDADTWVPPDWIRSNLAALEAGADAVAGSISLFPDDEAQLTAELRQRGAMEWHYEAILVEIDCLLDPIPHDPWPRHDGISGASLAVTLAAYDGVGGVPPVPVGEDRALGAALIRDGWRLRRDPSVRVVTSGRLVGRAIGGAADTIRLRTEDPLAACDPRLEEVVTAVRRARCRGFARRLYTDHLPLSSSKVASLLDVSRRLIIEALAEPTFERCWHRLEPSIPGLFRHTLYPGDLLIQLQAGKAALVSLREECLLKSLGNDAEGPTDTVVPVLAAVPA